MAFTRILAPTDFSAPAQHALRYAFEEAMLHQASVTLVHVLTHHTGTDVFYVGGAPEAPTVFDPALGGRFPSLQASPPRVVRQDHGEEAFQHLRDSVPASFSGRWEVEVTTGDPAEAIVRMAQAYKADLIVMGTHGRTGLPHVLLGSIAEKVVRLAPCPVLTIRYHEQKA
jgi:nucleotide-binding universal stress UspA family protein